jgi:uncharacterized repeat protein (TIGR01451 family)
MNQSSNQNHARKQRNFHAKELSVGQFLRNGVLWISLATLGLFSLNAFTADADAINSNVQTPIVISLKQFKIVKDQKGQEQRMDAALVLPGDVIEYQVTYANNGKTALPVVATLPIPESLEYIKDSASAKTSIAHTVALKDLQFAHEPLLQKQTTASGVTLSQAVPYASYRYVRWDLGRLSAGNSIEVSVRAKVAQNLEVDANAGDKAPVLVSSSLKK